MKTRVLHVVPNMNVGGLETFIMNVYRNIDRDKIQFDFLEHYIEPSVYDEEIEKLGGKIYHFSLRNDNNIFKYIIELNKFFKEHKEYKIVHCHMESIGTILFLVAKLNGVKIRIGHAHTTSTNNNLKGFVKKIISKPFKYTTTTNFACSFDAGEYLFKNKKYEVIPNAIDIDKFKFDENSRTYLRKELGLEGYQVIGHAGRMDKGKNQLFLIDIFNEYLKINSKSKLVLVGDGELRDEIIDRIKELNIEDKVLLLGVRKDVNKLYSAFDLFVFPSLFEGLGIVLIEAQVNGLTCLVSDNIPKITKISNKIKYLSLEDKSSWINEIKNSRKGSHQVKYNKLIDNYDIKILVKKLEKIYTMEG